MERASSHVEDRIKRGDPWYVASQLANLGNEAQVRIIRNRWVFFDRWITRLRGEREGAPLRVLDAGCGDGVNLSFLSGLEGLELSGSDYNPLRVERAREAFPKVRMSREDLLGLSFPDGRFDLVLCSQVLEHIPEDGRVLAELHRVVAPGGVLVLGVPNEGCLLARLRNRWLEPSIGRTTDHVHFYTQRAIGERARRAGFRLEEVMREGFFTPHQRIQAFLASREWGWRALARLGRWLPSQAAGLYLALRRPADPPGA